MSSNSSATLQATLENSVGDVTYSWSQVSGDTVTLSDTAAVSPTFTAPTVARETPSTLVFALSVTDETGRVGSDTITLTVTVPNRAVFLSNQRNVGVVELMIYDDVTGETKVLSGETSRDRDVVSWRWSPDETTIAFIAQESSESTVFVVKPDGSGLVSVATGSTATISWLPDSSRLVIRADAETSLDVEAFSCLPDGSSLTKISGVLVASGDVSSVAVAPDSSRVVIYGDLETDGVSELFSVAPDGTTPVKISRSLVFGGDVSTYEVAENGSVVYQADAETDDTSELYAVDADGTNPVKLSGTMVSGGSLSSFAVAPGSAYVGYRADQDVDGATELYAVKIDGTELTRLTLAASSSNDVEAFEWSPNGTRLAYRADMDVDGVDELYAVDANGANSVKLNGVLVSGGNVSLFHWAPDSTRLAYRADEGTNDVSELFGVAGDGTGRLKLSGTMVSGGDVSSDSVKWAPDSGRLVYLADQETNGRVELFTVAITGTPVKVNGLLNGSISSYDWVPDSSAVVYIASERGSQTELFATDADGSNHRILTETRGIVIADTLEYRISPDSQTVAYIGNQQTYFARDFFTVSIDGTNRKAHTNVPYTATSSTIRWSPDDSDD